jgi:transaldolase
MKFPLLSVMTFFLSSTSSSIHVVHSFASPMPNLLPRKHPTLLNDSTSGGNALEELAKMTRLSIDSGDLTVIEEYSKTGLITDATTNPLFVSQVAAANNGSKKYQEMVSDAISYAKRAMGGGDATLPDPDEKINLAMDKLAVNLGAEIARIVPGRVSTEVDIRLSYDTHGSIQRAKRIVDLYAEMGIDKSRILIKLAGTWEGIQAARVLEKEHNIQCNITLIFSFLQAAASAQAGAYLISPFPGRILDWYKRRNGKTGYPHPSSDPGVLLVKRMYAYFRKYGYSTICMPASWRPSRSGEGKGYEVDEILALAGIDEMTIPPALLESLQCHHDASEVERQCDPVTDAATCLDPDFRLTKESWDQYWQVDLCGQEKLAEGIAAFTKDTEKLREILIDQIG